MKAWLKGGLIGAGIAVLLTLIFFISFYSCNGENKNCPLGIHLFYDFIVSKFALSGFVHNFISANAVIVANSWSNWIATILIYFIIGAIIGLIVGKIKSKA